MPRRRMERWHRTRLPTSRRSPGARPFPRAGQIRSERMTVDRRAVLAGSPGLTVGAATTALLEKRKYHVIRKQPRSRGDILRAESYSHALGQIPRSGLDMF